MFSSVIASLFEISNGRSDRMLFVSNKYRRLSFHYLKKAFEQFVELFWCLTIYDAKTEGDCFVKVIFSDKDAQTPFFVFRLAFIVLKYPYLLDKVVGYIKSGKLIFSKFLEILNHSWRRSHEKIRQVILW